MPLLKRFAFPQISDLFKQTFIKHLLPSHVLERERTTTLLVRSSQPSRGEQISKIWEILYWHPNRTVIRCKGGTTWFCQGRLGTSHKSSGWKTEEIFIGWIRKESKGLPWWLRGTESACQCKRHRFDSWVRKIPHRRKEQSMPVFLPGKYHGQGSLVGYSPPGRMSRTDMT